MGLRQLGDVRRDPPRLVFCQQGSRSAARLYYIGQLQCHQ